MAKAEAFAAECKKNARPLKRNFYPGGSAQPVVEEHAAWFDLSDSGPHFGFGCTLLRNEVRYVGLYFFLDSANFRLANSAPFTFIDFQGNVGLRSPQGQAFTLLAVRKFTTPGRERTILDRNCEIGEFDPLLNQTIEHIGSGLSIHQISDDDPATITRCSDREIRYVESNCFRQRFRSFLNQTKSAIIHADTSIKVTEEARLYISSEIFDKTCGSTFRSALEFLIFVKELCGVK
jgi:hypothetical protein